MRKCIQGSNRFFNPVKLADDTVLALSAIKRGNKVAPEPLEEGVEFCNYLITLFESKETIYQREQWTFHAARDREILQESEIDSTNIIAKAKKVKKLIQGIIEQKLSPEVKQIESIQEFLIDATTPLWRKRISEFREKKLKWGLTTHD